MPERSTFDALASGTVVDRAPLPSTAKCRERGLSLIMTFSFNLAGLSSVAAIAAHAAFNTAFKFLGGIFKGVEPRIQIPFEMLLAVCGLAVAIVLIG